MLEKSLNLRCWSTLLKAQEETAEETSGRKAGELVMPELSYKAGELDPVLSSKTIDAHLQLQKKYVDRTRELVSGTEYADMALPEVIEKLGDTRDRLFHNAAQAWNHAFYWMSISPPGQDTAPTGSLLEAVEGEFGGIDECRDEIIRQASTLFGSGWVWLVQEDDKPVVVLSKDAGTPLSDKGLRPILCVDLWEHSYYLDYEIDRKSYIDSAVKQLLNWGFADRNWQGSGEW